MKKILELIEKEADECLQICKNSKNTDMAYVQKFFKATGLNAAKRIIQENPLIIPVDKDNLPEGEVIALSETRCTVGILYSSLKGIYCSTRENVYSGITHYMEIPKL